MDRLNPEDPQLDSEDMSQLSEGGSEIVSEEDFNSGEFDE